MVLPGVSDSKQIPSVDWKCTAISIKVSTGLLQAECFIEPYFRYSNVFPFHALVLDLGHSMFDRVEIIVLVVARSSGVRRCSIHKGSETLWKHKPQSTSKLLSHLATLVALLTRTNYYFGLGISSAPTVYRTDYGPRREPSFFTLRNGGYGLILDVLLATPCTFLPGSLPGFVKMIQILLVNPSPKAILYSLYVGA